MVTVDFKHGFIVVHLEANQRQCSINLKIILLNTIGVLHL